MLFPLRLSSSQHPHWGLAPGKVQGHRGGKGAFTVKVLSGDASPWNELTTIGLAESEEASPFKVCTVTEVTAYRDKLVFKVEGIETAEQAATLKGAWVRVLSDEEAPLPEGRWYVKDLIDREVRTITGERLGVVEGVIETGGVDLLSVRTEGGKTLPIPMATEILLSVPDAGALTVDLPAGLRELESD